MPQAVGSAYAYKEADKGQIVICYFGEGQYIIICYSVRVLNFTYTYLD